MNEQLEAEATDILAKLKFIAKFTNNKKVDVGTLKLFSDNWKTSLWRTAIYYISREESRNVTFEFVKGTVTSALKFLYAHYSNKHEYVRSLCNIILGALSEAKSGFSQLTDVSAYRADGMFTSKLETERELLETKIEDLKREMEALEKSKEEARRDAEDETH